MPQLFRQAMYRIDLARAQRCCAGHLGMVSNLFLLFLLRHRRNRLPSSIDLISYISSGPTKAHRECGTSVSSKNQSKLPSTNDNFGYILAICSLVRYDLSVPNPELANGAVSLLNGAFCFSAGCWIETVDDGSCD